MTPLTSAEIREWAINKLRSESDMINHRYDAYSDCLKDLIFYIDNESNLRQIMGEEE